MKVLIIQHVPHENSGILAPWLVRGGHAVEHLRLFQNPARFSKELLKKDAFVFMGGPMSVQDEREHPFLRDENLFIQDLLAKGKAVLGICLGSQLIAKALGARVYPASRKEIGWYTVDLTREGQKDPCFKNLWLEPEKRLRVFHWHGETFDLPNHAVRLARSRVSPNQAFRYGKKAYGFQFHLEMNQVLIRRWLELGRDEVLAGGFDPGGISRESRRYLPALEKNARVFFEAFIDEIKSNGE